MPFGTLQELSNEYASIVEKASKSAVRVDARHRVAGTGIVWSADGVIVTADHVVEREEGIEVLLPSGESVKAELIGRLSFDRPTALSVFQVAQDLEPPGTPAIKPPRIICQI